MAGNRHKFKYLLSKHAQMSMRGNVYCAFEWNDRNIKAFN